MSNKNNFRAESVKDKSKFKLWILFTPEAIRTFRDKKNPKNYFGFNTKRDGGLGALIKLAEKKSGQYGLAILYNNETKEEIRRWENKKLQQNGNKNNR